VISAGGIDLSTFESFEAFQVASRAIYHEDYDDGTLINDIALLELENPLEFSKLLSGVKSHKNVTILYDFR
jgi:secreted trypsin-like serine protease